MLVAPSLNFLGQKYNWAIFEEMKTHRYCRVSWHNEGSKITCYSMVNLFYSHIHFLRAVANADAARCEIEDAIYKSGVQPEELLSTLTRLAANALLLWIDQGERQPGWPRKNTNVERVIAR